MVKAISFSFLLNFIILLAQFIQFIDANWISGNLCWSMPCLNGGSCFGSAYTYLCVCPINYSGPLCEKRLGICQENPCGNRGLCVETGLTSFECRCYFDYMGPLCEEHVPKDDPTVWSSLIPVHTRVLLDFLQEAYRAKAQPKSSSIPNDLSVQQVFLPTSTIPTTISTSTMIIDEETTAQNFIRDTTEPEHVIRAENIQLEKIFPEISTASTSITEMSSSTETTTSSPLISSSTIESNETVEMFSDATTATTTTIASTETILLTTAVTENLPTAAHPTETITEPITLESTMENLTNASGSTTTTMITTTMMMNNVTNTTEYDRLMTNITLSITDDPSTTFEPTTIIASNETTSTPMISTEISSSTSSLTTESPVPVEDLLYALNKSETLRNRLLYKLCRQLLSQIFPNTSVSSINSTESAMSLTSNSSLMMNHTATALLSWIQEQLNSTSTTTLTATTATAIPTSTTTTTMISTTETTTIMETTTPVVASPLIQGRKLGSASSLQRINMDEALAWANESIDAEH